MLRKLGNFEKALYISDQHAPFNVVVVLRLENAPAPEHLRQSLEALQKRHPFLRARIKHGGFEGLSQPAISLTVLDQSKDANWMMLVEREMNTRLDASAGLFRCVYIYAEKQADLILTFHHTIIDSASGINLLDELLNLCAGGQPPLSPLEVAPAVEEHFPPSFKGLRGLMATMKYISAQMSDEILYRWKMRGKRNAPVHLGARGFCLSITLPESLVDALSRQCRIEKVTLNSLLNAVLLLSVNHLLYEGKPLPMRTFSFADLRPYTIPPISPQNLANYISMLRYTVEVSSEQDIWDLTKVLHAKIYHSLKYGDKFIASKMSQSLMKMFVTLKSMRMGATALNYSGAVPLKKQYGDFHVMEFHAFVSSFDLGPEVSAQARLFNDELWLDFMFLESDMDRATAGKIIGEIKSILEKAGSSLP